MVKKTLIITTLIFIASVLSEPPTFSDPQSLANIGLGSFGGKFYSPVHYDWDGDGDRDLLIGYFGDNGHIRLMLNTGSDASPRFEDQGDMKAGGARIVVGGV